MDQVKSETLCYVNTRDANQCLLKNLLNNKYYYLQQLPDGFSRYFHM